MGGGMDQAELGDMPETNAAKNHRQEPPVKGEVQSLGPKDFPRPDQRYGYKPMRRVQE
jgi:hypothetical protein